MCSFSLLEVNDFARAHVNMGCQALPAELLDHIVGKIDGVLLCVEELTKTLLEPDLLREVVEQFVLTGPLLRVVIPDTLQDSLITRRQPRLSVPVPGQAPGRLRSARSGVRGGPEGLDTADLQEARALLDQL